MNTAMYMIGEEIKAQHVSNVGALREDAKIQVHKDPKGFYVVNVRDIIIKKKTTFVTETMYLYDGGHIVSLCEPVTYQYN